MKQEITTGNITTAGAVILMGVIQFFISQNFATKEDLNNGFDRLESKIQQLDDSKVEKETFDVYKMYVEEKLKNK